MYLRGGNWDCQLSLETVSFIRCLWTAVDPSRLLNCDGAETSLRCLWRKLERGGAPGWRRAGYESAKDRETNSAVQEATSLWLPELVACLKFFSARNKVRGEGQYQLCFWSKPVQQLFTFQAINIITIMLKSDFGKFCPELLRPLRDSFRWDLSFWWKPNCDFGLVHTNRGS